MNKTEIKSCTDFHDIKCKTIENTLKEKMFLISTLLNTTLPISIFNKSLPIKRILSHIKFHLDCPTETIDFQQIKDVDKFMNFSTNIDNSAVYIFLNIDSISNHIKNDLSLQMIYHIFDNEDFMYHNAKIPTSTLKKIFIFNDNKKTSHILNLDYIVRRSYAIYL